MKQCFIYRTHKIDDIDKKVLLDYYNNLRAYCDVAISLNVPDHSEHSEKIINYWKNICDPLSIDLLVFREDDILQKYPHHKGTWLHSQMSFVTAFEILTSLNKIYDFYWYIEYDARISGSTKELLEHHEITNADLLGTSINSYTAEPAWYWFTESHVNLDIPLKERYKYFPALSRLSYRLCLKLTEAVLTQYAVVETLVPTVCVKYYGSKSVHNLDSKFWVNFEDLDIKNNNTAPLTLRFNPPFGNDEYYQNNLKNLKYNKLYHPIK